MQNRFLLILLFTCYALHGCTSGDYADLPPPPNDNKRHSLQIFWDPVTQDINHDDTTNVAGYQLTYGPTQNRHENTVNIEGQVTNLALIPRLPEGTYYFSMVALMPSGEASDTSNQYEFTIEI
ncbi:MAG: fibronectin type III domain-containing protein [Colwellia sp.]